MTISGLIQYYLVSLPRSGNGERYIQNEHHKLQVAKCLTLMTTFYCYCYGGLSPHCNYALPIHFQRDSVISTNTRQWYQYPDSDGVLISLLTYRGMKISNQILHVDMLDTLGEYTGIGNLGVLLCICRTSSLTLGNTQSKCQIIVSEAT